MTTWFINYMSSSYSFTPLMSSNYSSMFFMTFAIGRLLGGIIIQKIGTEKGLKICIGFASLSVLAGLILKESGLIILALSGIFFSVTYPSLIVLINATFKEFAPIALGIITTINFMIDMSCNVFIGYLNDVVGSYKAFFLVPVMMAVAFILLIVIYKRKNVTSCT